MPTDLYLSEITCEAPPDADGFPFDVPAIEMLERLRFNARVSFFVGENGSGKSTLLEAIACALNCPAIGQHDVSKDPMLAGAATLGKSLGLVKRRSPGRKLFFRAEDAIGFTRRVSADIDELKALEQQFDDELDGYGRQLATGAMRGQQQALTSRYGENPDARSHGQWFLEILKSRLQPGGLYLLDEPETPLSPIHQLSLLSLLKHCSEEEDCQFIIATHSPIVMALPGARLLSFDEPLIAEVAWEDLEHVAITRAFLNDPSSFLRHL